jgi:hypothetical protein
MVPSGSVHHEPRFSAERVLPSRPIRSANA